LCDADGVSNIRCIPSTPTASSSIAAAVPARCRVMGITLGLVLAGGSSLIA